MRNTTDLYSSSHIESRGGTHKETLFMQQVVRLYNNTHYHMIIHYQYCVTPTEPTNTSCPAQPCHTLNYYTNHSERYLKSNYSVLYLKTQITLISLSLSSQNQGTKFMFSCQVTIIITTIQLCMQNTNIAFPSPLIKCFPVEIQGTRINASLSRYKVHA